MNNGMLGLGEEQSTLDSELDIKPCELHSKTTSVPLCFHVDSGFKQDA